MVRSKLHVLLFSSAFILQAQSLPLFAAAEKDNAASHLAAAAPEAQNKESDSADTKPAKLKYKTEEPKLDLPSSPKRVQRPGSDASLPPLAPPISSSDPVTSPFPLLETPPPAPPKEKFPSVGQLEQLMFGHSSSSLAVENRLEKLETAIFQRTYNDKDIEHRIARLKEVVIGDDGAAPQRSPGSSPAYPPVGSYGSGNPGTYGANPAADYLQPPSRSSQQNEAPALAFPNYGHFDMDQELSIEEAERFGLVVLNEIRTQQGLDELSWDSLAYKVANEQILDLLKRNAVSHQNARGENPDLRYTVAGGKDTLIESAIMFPQAEYLKPTRQLVAKMIEALLQRQDDRQSLLFAHASSFSMSFQWTDKKEKLLCVTEVLTKHGDMDTIPLEASIGEKIEIKGSVAAPYRFHKLTLAWERLNSPPDDSSEQAEALPYFPPLDYEAHAIKSNRDFEKGVRILQIAGITAAIAGGMFIPPVALAAPLIAATVGTGSPKPVSEIKVRGGVKVSGANFSHKLTLNNDGKEGIYYLTVWASTPAGDEIFPVSRRAIIARSKEHSSGDDDEPAVSEPKADASPGKEKLQSQDDSSAGLTEPPLSRADSTENSQQKDADRDLNTRTASEPKSNENIVEAAKN